MGQVLGCPRSQDYVKRRVSTEELAAKGLTDIIGQYDLLALNASRSSYAMGGDANRWEVLFNWTRDIMEYSGGDVWVQHWTAGDPYVEISEVIADCQKYVSSRRGKWKCRIICNHAHLWVVHAEPTELPANMISDAESWLWYDSRHRKVVAETRR